MLPVGYEPTISAGERAQTYALDRGATGTGSSGELLMVVSCIGSLGLKIIFLMDNNIVQLDVTVTT